MFNKETGRYNSPVPGTLSILTHGSHLYGTNTETSDHDFKIIYLPDLPTILLSYRPKTFRFRHDKDGVVVADREQMTAGGSEAEVIPVQSFINDYLGGRAYAMEIVYAQLQKAWYIHRPDGGKQQWVGFNQLCSILHTYCAHQNITEMLGFASKQTMDYVQRAQRLQQAEKILAELEALREDVKRVHGQTTPLKLNSVFREKTLYRWLAEKTGIEIGETYVNDCKRATLKLNGREYLTTMAVSHFRNALMTLVKSYGERVRAVANSEVEWKSMYHAIRTYEQIIEYLETQWITYPRPNVQELMAIKNGLVPFEEVRTKFEAYDRKVQELLATTKLPKVDDYFRQQVEAKVKLILLQLYRKQLETS